MSKGFLKQIHDGEIDGQRKELPGFSRPTAKSPTQTKKKSSMFLSPNQLLKLQKRKGK